MLHASLKTIMLAGALALAACDGGTDGVLVTGPGGGEGDDDFVVTVTSTLDGPTFSWPGVAARTLTVSRVDDGRILWQLNALDASVGFTSPVVFGVVPAGGAQEDEPEPLVAGVTHRVSITLITDARGTRDFTPGQ